MSGARSSSSGVQRVACGASITPPVRPVAKGLALHERDPRDEWSDGDRGLDDTSGQCKWLTDDECLFEEDFTEFACILGATGSSSVGAVHAVNVRCPRP